MPLDGGACWLGGLFLPPWWASFLACPACASKAFTLAVATLAAQFFSTGLSCASVVHQQHPSGSVSVSNLQVFGQPIDTPVQKYLFVPGILVVFGLAGQKPGARRHWPRVDGHSRHGRGRRRHWHSPHVRQAQRLCGQLLHHGRGRRAVGLCAPGRLGACGVLGGPLLSPAVHGHHRRHGLHHGQLFWGRLHRGACPFSLNQAFQPWVAWWA
jgi:hypothetical protein